MNIYFTTCLKCLLRVSHQQAFNQSFIGSLREQHDEQILQLLGGAATDHKEGVQAF